MPTRHASATWTGDLRSGKGNFSGESGAVSGEYSFGTRFGDVAGTNPEELLAAADAACFSMALSGALAKAGMTAEKIETKAACTIEKVGDGFKITRMKLDCTARVPGADRDAFKDVAEATKSSCPVSTALMGNVEIELDARLEEG
ncbi:MAG: OsmC family peroxiredoxin [Gemmatirosa sp.]